MNSINIFGIEIPQWILFPVLYMIWLVVCLTLKIMIYSRIRKLAKKTKTQIDDIFLEALNIPLKLLIFVGGAVLLKDFLPLKEDGSAIAQYFHLSLKITSIVAIILFIDRLFRSLITTYASKNEFLKTSGNIMQGVVRSLVLAIGVLILLDSFGVSITPILASLGVGSLAVALALQPTLENFFAGMQLIIDKSIKVGQFIKLDSGEEGYVTRIGWRSTKVRMLPNNTVVIPNKAIVTSKVLNYYYPEKQLAVLIQVGVHYNSDLEHVERVTIEVGKEIMETVNGGVMDFTPFIRYHTFADFSINFTVILRAKEFVDGYLIKHEFIKKLHARYRDEGICIPYPIRATNNAQEQAFVKS